MILIQVSSFRGSWYLLEWPDFQQFKQLQERIYGGINICGLKFPCFVDFGKDRFVNIKAESQKARSDVML